MDVVSSGAIDVDGIIAELQAIHTTMQENQLSLEEKLFQKFDFDIETLLNSFFKSSYECQSVIVGILAFMLLCFAIWLVYKFIRMFV